MTDLNSYHLTSSGIERVDAMPDPTDADLSAITEAELDEIEARLKHGDNFLIRKDAWTLHDALRACRGRAKAKDAVVEAAQEMRSGKSYQLSRSFIDIKDTLTPAQRLGRLWKALEALDKEVGDADDGGTQ